MKENYPKEYLLSLQEEKILRLLQKGSLSVSNISKQIKIPRTTLYTPIKSLIKRGLVSAQRVSKESILQSKTSSNTESDRSVKIYRGAVEIINHMVYLLTSNKYYKIKNIETIEGMKSIFKNMKIKDTLKINRHIRFTGQIIEAVLEDGYLEEYKKASGKEWVKLSNSLIGRPFNTSFIQKYFLQPYIQIMIFSNCCFFINWKTLVAYKYTDKDTVDFYDQYFEMLKENARRVDINIGLKEE